MFEEGGEVQVRQIGYFAGSEPEFAKMFADYQRRDAADGRRAAAEPVVPPSYRLISSAV